MTDAIDAPRGTSKQRKPTRVGGPWAPAGFSWSLFEFARNPYYMLVVIYVFAPYFSKHVAGGGVEGAAKVADVITVSGIICALTAPFLGAMMDRGGKRKGILGVFIALIVLCAIGLWWSTPTGGIGVAGTAILLTTAFCAYTYSEVMHNAMLPAAGVPKALPHISGMGLGLGNLAAVIGLLVVAGLSIGQVFGPADNPLHELERFTGPYTGIWMAIFVIPFFLFMPDGAIAGGTWRGAAAELLGLKKNNGFNPVERLGRLRSYFVDLFRTSPDTMKFLIGRMIYADGLTAVMTLAGVYTATFLGWSGLEVALYGIYGSVFAAIGAFCAGPLDRALGAKGAIIVEIVVTMIMIAALLSITPDSIFYGLVPGNHAVWGGPVFNTLSDVTYLVFVGVIAASITACISSSRYMLVAVAPKERVGEFFGFYAMAATLTVWMGPALYSFFSRQFNDQRIGMASLSILFVVGLAILLMVKHDGRPTGDTPAVAH
jgi:MFS transporter, UMF1 family